MIPPNLKIDCDEDFIDYMDFLAQSVCARLHTTRDEKKILYYQGILFAVKSISQVYEDLLKGDYI